MSGNQLQPREALNKAYLKVKPDGERIGEFKANLVGLIDLINETKSEEFHKNLIIEFLKKTYYGDRYFINTKENSDLVIHNQKGVESKVGVIFETKKPTKTNNAEMPKVDNLNAKAFQQLVLYFLRERVTYKNLDIRYLIVTNVYEWFIFDATIFEQLFFNDKALVSEFTDFVEKRLSGKKTDFFYKQIAEPAIKAVIDQIKFTHFDIRNYEKFLRNTDGQDDRELIDLYKLLSPEHLLKLPFTNDSNSLNKPFYNELLYIIGLAETKDGGKKLIGRVKDCDRNMGSLIENAINELDSSDKISQLKKPEEFGVADDERLFNVALRLAITWINRVLFLKLLEAQLLKYHGDDQNFAFLNLAKIKNYGDLNRLFFSVLAREHCDRVAGVKEIFANVPYLNSSLFEPTDIEQQTISISNLASENLPIFGATVLADSNGKRRSGELNALEYLFEFLGAYRFNKDELESGEEDSEKLINSAVLGLIFEKINGYKDGSFYTPSFITMYMCRETIRRAVVQKFNEVKGWNCQGLDDLYERIEDKKEANAIINSLKICDPAVGSGHFLVSALNEMIAIKSELRVLLDRTGKSLKDYRVEVRNDKLLVYDDEGKLFAYHPNNAEKQRVQESLFHEKQTIIESCLFGVDINPNSVTICRLRLWIELLKNAYYRVDGNLETLPNIDINIKCGNSLISRFGLDVDVKQVLKKQKFSIEQYRNAVQTYRSAESKAQKREMETLITKIKAGFSSTLLAGDPKKVKLRQLQAELYSVENQTLLFEETKAEVKVREKKVNKLNNEIDKLTAEIEDIESGRLYENALEWRFEFPEVLNNNGDFVGFDIVIGNPPWGAKIESNHLQHIKSINSDIIVRMIDSFMFFINLTFSLKSKSGIICQIVPDVILYQVDNEKLRDKIFKKHQLEIAFNLGDSIFTDVARPSCIILITSNITGFSFVGEYIARDGEKLSSKSLDKIETSFFEELPNKVITTKNIYGYKIINRIKGTKLIDLIDDDGIQRGVSPDFKDAFIVDDKTVQDFSLEKDFIFPTLTGGKDMKKYLVYDIGKRVIYTKKQDDPELIPKIINYLNSFRDQITCVEVKEDKHPFWSLHRPRNSSIFTKKEKIIGVITGDKVIVAPIQG
jgi:adenine-specific DNA-methyltransferase